MAERKKPSVDFTKNRPFIPRAEMGKTGQNMDGGVPTYTFEGIRVAAEVSGVSICEFLRLYPVEVTTAAEAKVVFEATDKNTDLARWEKLALKQAKAAKNLSEDIEAFEVSPEDYMLTSIKNKERSARVLASKQRVNHCTTKSEAWEAYEAYSSLLAFTKWVSFWSLDDAVDFTENSTTWCGSSNYNYYEEEVARNKIKSLATELLDGESTVRELSMVILCRKFLDDSLNRIKLLPKVWDKIKERSLEEVKQLSTASEAKKACEALPPEFSWKSFELRWKKLSLEQAKGVKTEADVVAALEVAYDEEDKKTAVRTWIPLCVTVAEAKKARELAPDDETKRMALDKVLELSNKK
jgi:hypothetical protein